MSTMYERPEWHLDASCSGTGADLFFPRSEGSSWHIDKAKSFCLECPVKEECLQFAIDTNAAHGIWGGMTAKEVRRYRRRVNDRKRKNRKSREEVLAEEEEKVRVEAAMRQRRKREQAERLHKEARARELKRRR